MRLVDDPDDRFWYPPAACRGCGADLSGQEVFAQRRHQVTDIEPVPAPEVTEHVAQAKQCPCCGDGQRGDAAGGRAGAGQLRAGGMRAGREPDLRELHPVRAGRRR